MIAGCILVGTLVQARGPSTPEERAKALQLARMLEADPFANGAPDARRWLIIWIGAIPDITVTICPDLLPPLLETNSNYASEIFVQMMFSSAAFIIEHPDKEDDLPAVYKAGLRRTKQS